MAETFIRRLVRLEFEPGQTELVKTFSGAAATCWQGAGLEIRATLVIVGSSGAKTLFDISNLTGIQLYIYKISDESTLIGPISASDSNPTLDATAYAAGGYHFRFKISATEANNTGIDSNSGLHRFRIQGYTSDDGADLDVLGVGEITFNDPGNLSPGAAPAASLSYPGYEQLLGTVAAIAKRAAFEAVSIEGIPDDIDNPTYRRRLGVDTSGNPYDQTV
jgi:hypothetical protein